MSAIGEAFGGSFEELSFLLIQEFLSVPDQIAVREGMDSFSKDLHAFKDIVIDGLMMSFG